MTQQNITKLLLTVASETEIQIKT